VKSVNYGEHMRTGYSSEEAYPPVKVTAPNIYYANVLMDDYAGQVSEFTAIMQYLYGDFISDNEDIGKLFENISINEMMHLDILATLIKDLGGNPIYYDSYANPWISSNVFYSKNIVEQLIYSIRIEKEAINGYIKSIDLIKDLYVQDVLKRIIKDEELHIKLFEEALNKIEKHM
jgi:bacterioferritin